MRGFRSSLAAANEHSQPCLRVLSAKCPVYSHSGPNKHCGSCDRIISTVMHCAFAMGGTEGGHL